MTMRQRWGASALAVCMALGTAGPSVLAQAPPEWPQFRGRNAGAVANDPALPDTWSRTENVAWAVEVPGLGWGSPVVAGGPRLRDVGDQRGR